MSQRLHSDHINTHQESQSNSSQPKPASEKHTNSNDSLTEVLIQFDLNQICYLSALNMHRCGCAECFRGGFMVLWYTLYCTSGGTLNFSTTPSSKKQRIPHLMSSNSDKGKSLKRNSRSSTVLASGMLVFWEFETHRKQSACHPKQPEFMTSIVVNVSQCLPTVCTSPSRHSPLVRSRTSLECSEWGGIKKKNVIGFPSGWNNISQQRQQLTRMVCTSVSVAVVWYMSISWEISLPHSVLFSLSYVSLHRVDQPRNWVRAWWRRQKNPFDSKYILNYYQMLSNKLFIL